MKKMLFLTVTLVVVLTSCDEFFTTSLGRGMERKVDRANITVNEDNIDTWVARAKGDPALTDELLGLFKDKAEDPDLSAEEQAQYANGGISVATGASGTGSMIFTNGMDTLTEMLETSEFNAEATEKLMDDMLKGYSESTAAQDSSEYIADVVGKSIASGSAAQGQAPTFPQAFIDAVKPDEAGMTILLLALSVVNEKGINVNDLKDLGNVPDLGLKLEDGKITIAGTPSAKTIALAAYVNLVTQNDKFKDNKFTEMFGKFFDKDSGSVDASVIAGSGY